MQHLQKSHINFNLAYLVNIDYILTNMFVKMLKYLPLVFVLFVSSCGGDKEGKEDSENKGDQKGSENVEKTVKNGVSAKTSEGKGGVMIGGVMNLAEEESYTSLFPHAIEDLVSSQIATQLYDGLMKFNPGSLELENALAESHSVSEDGLEYTFTLRQGAKFHDNACFEGGKGRNVTAADFKFSFELLCDSKNVAGRSNFENIFKDVVMGATEYYEGKADNVPGFEVVDDYTFKIKLVSPRSSLLYKLAQSPTFVFAKEAYEKYGDQITVGCGPFVFSRKEGNHLYLAKNQNYYLSDEHGNKLPYLDTIHFVFVDNKSEQVEMFENQKIDVLKGLPADKVTEMVQERISEITGTPAKKMLVFNPELASQYYEFNMTRPHFKDVRVRQAFNYAIDRKKVIDNVLKNQAHEFGDYGITPPVKIIKDYPFDSLHNYGYSYNPEKAKKLMAEAGYPNGKNFPILKLEINSGGKIHNKIAKEVVKQLESVLGIHVNQEVVPFAQKMEDAKYGRADMFRSAWVADYPDPETFLTNCYGKNVPNSLDEPSHPNTMRYKNATFDKYFEAGISANNKEDRYENFYLAEKTMLQDPPIIPLWYTEDYKFYYTYLRGYEPNALEYLDLSRVYLKEWTKDEWIKAHH